MQRLKWLCKLQKKKKRRRRAAEDANLWPGYLHWKALLSRLLQHLPGVQFTAAKSEEWWGLQQTEASRGVIMCTHGLCAGARQQALIDADSVQSESSAQQWHWPERTPIWSWRVTSVLAARTDKQGRRSSERQQCEVQEHSDRWGFTQQKSHFTKQQLTKSCCSCASKKTLRGNSTLILISCDHLWCLSSSTALGCFSYVSHNAFQ